MCGIAGAFQPGTPADAWPIVLGKMASTLAHRGPDDQGIWADREAGLGLAHRRLSILDLSPEGHQPMLSESGRFVISFNGEIYNYLALREELGGAGVRWRGHSDTEVMLAAFEAWGVLAALRRFAGIFAFALWDRNQRALFLARDHLGVKPLYFGEFDGALLFGSELKALRAHPAFRGEIDRDALTLLLRHDYIPAPHSIYRRVSKLPPGTVLTARWNPDENRFRCETETYWTARQTTEQGARDPLALDEPELTGQLDRLLRDVVKSQMISDVPLGAFLSGGIDSSLLAGLMQAQSSAPVKTFSIGFREQGYDEAPFARRIAAHLGTDHTELYVGADDGLALVPRLPTLWDEPFADASQLPTFLLSQLTRRHVTVSLSGDGGDELFCGYSRYRFERSIWKAIRWMPLALRRAVASRLLAASPADWNRRLAPFGAFLPRGLNPGRPGERLHRLAAMLAAPGEEALYQAIVSHWPRPAENVLGAREPLTALSDPARWARVPDATQHMMYVDAVTYLPDDILVKVDRASMGVGLEARVPFLDHRVFEFAARVPLSMKFREGEGKWILRRLLARYVPPQLFERPKMGFAVPLDSWLRGPLRDWAEALLDEHRLRREGYFEPDPIRQRWLEHLADERRSHYPLWNVLMFQSWLEAQGAVA